jgi:hypothetical protein
MEELEAGMPDKMKRTIAEKNLNFYTIDASKVAKEIGLGNVYFFSSFSSCCVIDVSLINNKLTNNIWSCILFVYN